MRTTTDNTQGKWFVSAVVWAEVRKSASYKVDVSMNNDAMVQEAECRAGLGPTAHCKHVAAVLFGLTLLSDRNYLDRSDMYTGKTF